MRNIICIKMHLDCDKVSIYHPNHMGKIIFTSVIFENDIKRGLNPSNSYMLELPEGNVIISVESSREGLDRLIVSDFPAGENWDIKYSARHIKEYFSSYNPNIMCYLLQV